MPPAHHHVPLADDGEGPLFAGQLRPFLDAIGGGLGRPAEDGEDRRLPAAADGVVPPLPRRHHAAIDPQDGVQLTPVEEHLGPAGGTVGDGGDV